ncbi:AzlD family protein [Salinispirillum marinum]|uniref:AzlD family protein n=2 Tax=Saccharospirillaceae TaxID=255527 RepID=A0ABV8BE39_9GAMM
MTLALTPTTGVILILLMAIVSYLTRIGGIAILAQLSIGPRTERFIQAMSGSALVAIVAPAAAAGDNAARLALVATFLTMLLTRKALLAIAAGILTAALWRVWF